MKLVVTVENTDTILNVDVSDEMTLADLKAYIEAETDIKADDQILSHNSKELNVLESSLVQLGLSDDELLVLKKKPSPLSNNSANDDQQIEQERQQLLNDPFIRQNAGNPQLSNILNNPQLFRQFVNAARSAGIGAGSQFGGLNTEPLYDTEIARLRSLPDSAENRKKIEDLQDLQAIEENRLLAYEMAPETFTQVPMLYIRMEVNNVPVNAFVDTGAQMTIMSPKLAEKCGLKKLIDTRFRGEARGVGSGQILGRIHSAPVKIEDAYIPCSFVILESGVDLILGLDMLRRHLANVDLKLGKLFISDVSTPFLSERESQDSFFSSMGPGLGNKLGSETKRPRLNNPMEAAASAAAARATPSNSALSSAPVSASASVDPAKIEQLCGLGFSKEQAVVALQQCEGNVELAASLLFQ